MGVDIRYYSVIYQAIDEVEAALKGMLKPEYEEVQLGTAEIREIFKVPRVGNVAGAVVRSGVIKRNAKARLIRDGVVISDNLTVESLRRFKDDVTEVREGFGVRYRNRLQRHPRRRHYRDVRDAGEAARLTFPGCFRAPTPSVGARSPVGRTETSAPMTTDLPGVRVCSSEP